MVPVNPPCTLLINLAHSKLQLQPWKGMHAVELSHLAYDCAAVTLLPQRNKFGRFFWFGFWFFFFAPLEKVPEVEDRGRWSLKQSQKSQSCGNNTGRDLRQ